MVDPKSKEFFFNTMKRRYNRCLEPALQCEKKSIRAHSIQRATALSLIAKEGHVHELKLSIKKDASVVELSTVGIGYASTFPGFCSEHDSEIFRPLDTKPFAIGDKEQLFLLAYRSVTRELHATLEGASRVQSSYLNLIEHGKVTGDVSSPVGMEALSHWLKAWRVWRYRYDHFEQNFAKGDFGNIRHIHFFIRDMLPVLAASSFFSAELKAWGEPFAAIIVNVVPLSAQETVVVFSFARSQGAKVVQYLRPITTSGGKKKLYELSYLLIDRAENFYLAPSMVETWSSEKISEIEHAFLQEFFGKGDPKRSSRLDLFAAT